MDARKTITERLLRKLKGAAHEKVRTRRMDYMTIPFSTDATFDGLPVYVLMVPQVSAGGLENEAVFDTWCSVICEEGGGLNDAVRAIRELGRSDLADFLIANSTDIESASVMLLFALGREAGAALEFDHDGATVTHGGTRFGIANGVVFSRFSTGFKLGVVDPTKVLNSVRRIRAFDSAFIAFYREAYRVGEDALVALIALRCGDPNFSFRNALKRCRVRRIPNERVLRSIEDVILKSKDPISRLYTRLVPEWITASEFRDSFCNVTTRNRDPTKECRLRYINSLHEFFHKNKNNRNQHGQDAKQHTT